MNAVTPLEPHTVVEAALPAKPPERWSRWVAARWALVPFLLLGVLSVGLAVMVYIAVHDPGFAVEPEYYQHALKWDEQRARVEHDARLGWRVAWNLSADANRSTEVAGSAQLRSLSFSLRDAFGAKLRGARVSASAFHNARAAEVQQLTFSEQATGQYTAELRLSADGLWHVQLEVDAQGQHFSHTTELELDLVNGRVLSRRTDPATSAATTSFAQVLEAP